MIGLLVGCTHPTEKVVLSFTGDILLSRGVGEKVSEEGTDYPYIEVAELLNSDDMTIGNLECPITVEGDAVYKYKEIIFKANPENSKSLRKAGYDMLNLANNHTMDYGSVGLEETIKNLESSSISFVGGGNNYEQARKLKVEELNGSTFGFLGYSVFPPEGYIHVAEKPTVSHYDNRLIKSEIEEAKKECDYLVVSMHWGNEYDKYPSEQQKKVAKQIIDAGADVIIGHHPHVLQSIEKYKGKYIFYSLGNFIFDRQIQNGTDETVILQLHYSEKSDVRWEVIPVIINDCQPRLALKDEAQEVVGDLARISSEDIVIIKKNDRFILQ